MNPRFITKSLHAYLDYPVALALITLPFVLGLGSSHPMAFWLSVGTGVAAFALTLLTDHKFGVLKVVPYSLHLAVDFAVAIVFLVAPFALGFTGIDTLFYLANGAAVLMVVGLHQPERQTAADSVQSCSLNKAMA